RLIVLFCQAEDGIRDLIVTGVQTCALPISADHRVSITGRQLHGQDVGDRTILITAARKRIASAHHQVSAAAVADEIDDVLELIRSEERRVGKEWRARWGQGDEKDNAQRVWE